MLEKLRSTSKEDTNLFFGFWKICNDTQIFETQKGNLNNKKNMIELIKSMEELIHQKKSNWTTKYVVDKILERITLNIHTV